MNVLCGRIGVALILFVSALGLLYAAYSHGVKVTDAKWNAKWADQQVVQARNAAAAAQLNRDEEQRRQSAANKVGSDARAQIKMATDTGTTADAAGDRVRNQAGKLAAGTRCGPYDTDAAERGQAATRAAMVLSDLFQRADKRAGELAKAYDAARIAGQACEGAYDSLRINAAG